MKRLTGKAGGHRGSRFDTISVQQGEKNIYYAQFLFIYFEQTVVKITKCST